MSSDGYIFGGNISWICPACGNKTHYRREGYDGEKGEGQYCDTCKNFLSSIIQAHIFSPMQLIRFSIYQKQREAWQASINKRYAEIATNPSKEVE